MGAMWHEGEYNIHPHSSQTHQKIEQVSYVAISRYFCLRNIFMETIPQIILNLYSYNQLNIILWRYMVEHDMSVLL